MTPSTDVTHPEQKVAARIVHRFVADGLMPAAYAERVAARLGEKQMREEDWRLLAEAALDAQDRSAVHG